MPPEENEVEKRIRDSVSIELIKAQYNEILNLLREIREDIKDHEARLRDIENKVKEKTDKEDFDTLDKSVTRLQERLSIFTAAQSLFTMIVGGISAWFGGTR